MKTDAPPIDVEAVKEKPEPETTTNTQTAIAKFEGGGAVGRALTVKELHERLEFVRQVMKEEMKEGQDFGKIPGTGEKPSLLQPGAQKLLMTFNLREQVKKETLREFPTLAIPGHREYEFVVTVFPSGMTSENGWDGVGTCSTLESKYRYRKQERRCPECGKEKIIQGKAEYGGGWLCWKKKGGCGATFAESDKRIADQDSGTVEYENPADYWNTVRKMAFKRAIVHAAINATNTSELWTQDVEEMAQNAENAPKRPPAGDKPRQNAPGTTGTRSAPPPPPPPATNARQGTQAPAAPPPATKPTPKDPTPETRKWMIKKLENEGITDIAVDYFLKLTDPSPLMWNEGLEDLPLRFVPNSMEQLRFLIAAIKDFANGDEAKHAYPAHKMPEEKRPDKAAPPREAPKPTPKKAPADSEYWRDVIVPIPNKGQKRGDYITDPDTIGSLYDQCKSGTEAACKRLWGFVNHFEPKPWTGRDGKQYPPSDTDVKFREALDAFKEWHDKNGKDTTGDQDSKEPPGGWQGAATADPACNPEDEETPFDRV